MLTTALPVTLNMQLDQPRPLYHTLVLFPYLLLMFCKSLGVDVLDFMQFLLYKRPIALFAAIITFTF